MHVFGHEKGLVPYFGRVPELTCVHEEPNDVEDLADHDESQGQFYVHVVEVVQEVDREEGSHYD